MKKIIIFTIFICIFGIFNNTKVHAQSSFKSSKWNGKYEKGGFEHIGSESTTNWNGGIKRYYDFQIQKLGNVTLSSANILVSGKLVDKNAEKFTLEYEYKKSTNVKKTISGFSFFDTSDGMSHKYGTFFEKEFKNNTISKGENYKREIETKYLEIGHEYALVNYDILYNFYITETECRKKMKWFLKSYWDCKATTEYKSNILLGKMPLIINTNINYYSGMTGRDYVRNMLEYQVPQFYNKYNVVT